MRSDAISTLPILGDHIGLGSIAIEDSDRITVVHSCGLDVEAFSCGRFSEHNCALSQLLLLFYFNICRSADTLHISHAHWRVCCRREFWIIKNFDLQDHNECPVPGSAQLRISTKEGEEGNHQLPSLLMYPPSQRVHLLLPHSSLHPPLPNLQKKRQHPQSKYHGNPKMRKTKMKRRQRKRR